MKIMIVLMSLLLATPVVAQDLENEAILSGFKTQYEGDLESKMMHSVLLQFDDIVLYNHRNRKRNNFEQDDVA